MYVGANVGQERGKEKGGKEIQQMRNRMLRIVEMKAR